LIYLLLHLYLNTDNLLPELIVFEDQDFTTHYEIISNSSYWSLSKNNKNWNFTQFSRSL